MAVITWKPNTVGGLWTDPNNWIGGVVPGPADAVVFGGGASNAATIVAGATVAAASVDLAATTGFNEIDVLGTLDLSGTLAAGSGGAIESNSNGTAGAGEISGGTLDLSGGGSVSEITANAVTLVGAAPAGQAYSFSPARITGGLTSFVPLLAPTTTTDLAGTQVVSALEIDPLTVTLGGTVTLAAGTLIRNNPAYLNTGYALTFENDATGGGVLVNDGTIIDTGSLDMYVNLVNAGQISLLGNFDDFAAVAVANSGTITVGSTEDLTVSPSTGQVFANTGLLSVNAGGTLGVGGTLANAGGVVSLGAAASLTVPIYAYYGTVQGGTVVSASGIVSGETLDGVSLAGTFANLGGSATGSTGFVSQTPGVRATATLASGLGFLADALVDDVNLTLLPLPGTAAGLASAGALTLGPSSDVAFGGTPSVGYSSSVTAATALLLGGTVEAFAGPVYLGAGSGGIVNTGTISTVAGETLTLGPAARLQDQTTSFANDGVLQVAAGSVIALDANVTAAGFAGLTQNGATLEIGGTIDGSASPGGTITLAAGSVVQTGGLIRDVTVADNTPLSVGGTLDGVTWQGLPLDVSNHGNTVVRNGFSVIDASGGLGSIVVGGTNSILNIQTDTTLDHVNVTVGSTLADPGTDSFSVIDGTNPSSGVDSNLTIGPNASVTIGGNEAFNGLNNLGTLTIDGTLQVRSPNVSAAVRAFDVPGGPTDNLVIVSGGKIILNPLYKNMIDDGQNAFMIQQQESADAQELMNLQNSVAYYLTTLQELSHSLKSIASSAGVAVFSTATPLPDFAPAKENTIDGAGTLSVGNNGLFVLNSNIGAGIDLSFDPSAGIFALPDPTNFSGQISGFGAGDAVDLSYLGYTGGSATYANGQLSIPTAGGTFALNTQFAAGNSAADVALADDGQGGTFAYIRGTDTAAPTTDTVLGADGVTRSVAFGSAALAALAAPLLAATTPQATLFADAPGSYALSGAQTAAVDTAAGSVTLTGNAAANETIAAGAGAFAFQDGGGSGTVIAGAGADSIYVPGGGNWDIALGDGADTVVAAAGNDSVSTGIAGSFVFLGSGASSVSSAGADTILGSTGAATVSAIGAASDELFALGGPLAFIAGSGASTVVSGATTATLFGGAGGTLMFGDGATQVLGSGGTDTVVGLAGSMTVSGGSGGGLYFGGSAGGNVITAGAGDTTAFGGGAGDVLTATGAGSDLFAGGVGAETLTGAGSSGQNTFFAGFGPETLVGGAGNTALVAGAGADLLVGGSGLTLFLFVDGHTVGAADTISGFDPSHDFVKLAGYSGDEATTVANAAVVGGSSVISLSDGTSITFAGVPNLVSGSFT